MGLYVMCGSMCPSCLCFLARGGHGGGAWPDCHYRSCGLPRGVDAGLSGYRHQHGAGVWLKEYWTSAGGLVLLGPTVAITAAEVPYCGAWRLYQTQVYLTRTPLAH